MEGQGMRLPLHGLPVPGSIPNLDFSAETGMGMRSGVRGALHQRLTLASLLTKRYDTGTLMS